MSEPKATCNLKEHAGVQKHKKTVTVVVAEHADTLLSIGEAREQEVADFILCGDIDAITAMAGDLKVSLEGVRIIPSESHTQAASDAVNTIIRGEAQVLMKGGIHTADFMRAILHKEAGLVAQGALLSHVALICIPSYHKPVFLTDAALNILPDIEAKKKILLNAIQAAKLFGITIPKVACIAPVEVVTPKIVSTVDAQKLVLEQQASGLFGQAIVEGPFAIDVAFSEVSAAVKGIAGEVPGHPDILLMPNLDAANGVFKSLALIPGVVLAGIVLGAKVPVVLTSRSDSEETRLNSLLFALSIAE